MTENVRLQLMAKELEDIKIEVGETKALLKDVYTLLAGNPLDKTANGLISEFKNVQYELNVVKGDLKKYKSYFYALVTLVGLGFFKFITDFLTKK
jgi:hypothetical protein